MKPLEDRVAGVLFGLAAGDLIGGPVRMALRVAESLSNSGGFDISDIARRYLHWWRAGAFDTGPTVARVLALVESGLSFEQASTRVHAESEGMTAGCNPAHRATALATCSRVDDVLLGRLAVAEAGLTHRHALAGDDSAAATRLCRALIRGDRWTVALALSAQGRAPETRRALHVKTETGISRSGFAPDVLGTSVYFVQASASFSEALARTASYGCTGESGYQLETGHCKRGLNPSPRGLPTIRSPLVETGWAVDRVARVLLLSRQRLFLGGGSGNEPPGADN